MNATVRLFAAAREILGQETLEIALKGGETVSEIRQKIVAEHPDLASLVHGSMIAVDGRYANDEQRIESVSEIAVIPPVSGG